MQVDLESPKYLSFEDLRRQSLRRNWRNNDEDESEVEWRTMISYFSIRLRLDRLRLQGQGRTRLG